MRLQFEDVARKAAAELARGLRRSNAARLFGFTLTAAEPGRAILKMRVRDRHLQIHGVVHGGVLAALADTAGALSCFLALPRRTRLATIEMKINYLEPVAAGALWAEGRLLRKGRNFCVAECDLREGARLVAKALLTFAITGWDQGPHSGKSRGRKQ
jgi:uncharacterized protein (TIGR00369 family)